MKSTKQLGRIIMCLGTLLCMYGLFLILKNTLFPSTTLLDAMAIADPSVGIQHFFCAICIIAIGFLTYERNETHAN